MKKSPGKAAVALELRVPAFPGYPEPGRSKRDPKLAKLISDQAARRARGQAVAKAIGEAVASAAKARQILVVNLADFEMTTSSDDVIYAIIEADEKLRAAGSGLKLTQLSPPLWKTFRRCGLPNRMLGKEPKAEPKARAVSKEKATPKARPAGVATVLALWVVPKRPEDAALLKFLGEHKVATPKPALALGKQKFEADTDLVWHFFTKEVPVCVATTKAGKPKLEVHRAEPESGVDEAGQEYDDYGGKYNQWDFIKPLVEGKPIVVQRDVIYVGFNALQAEVLDGRRALG